MIEKNIGFIKQIIEEGIPVHNVGGIAGSTHFTSLEDKLVTIDLRIDYLKGAEASEIIVEGKIVRLGNRILVTKMKAFQNDELIAEGKGVYNFIRINKSTEK
jgi:acyl-coenzyme A thioesterase PaaI-like protein